MSLKRTTASFSDHEQMVIIAEVLFYGAFGRRYQEEQYYQELKILKNASCSELVKMVRWQGRHSSVSSSRGYCLKKTYDTLTYQLFSTVISKYTLMLLVFAGTNFHRNLNSRMARCRKYRGNLISRMPQN